MKLNELRALINQQAIQSKIETLLNEVGPYDITRQQGPAKSIPTIEDYPEREHDLTLDYFAKKFIIDDIKTLPDKSELKRGALRIAPINFKVNPELEAKRENYSLQDIIGRVIDIADTSGEVVVQKYKDHLNNELMQARHEPTDKSASIDAISDTDDLELTNVDPITGEPEIAKMSNQSSLKTVSGGKVVRETDEINMMNEAIRNIKSILGNR